MRYTILILIIVLGFSACKKDQYTTTPQISFRKFNPNQGNNRPLQPESYLIFEVRDSEGDLDTDSALIYVKNTLTGKEVIYNFPNLGSAAGKNFKGDVQVALSEVMGGRDLPPSQRPYVDTISFEVYVRDFAKNKSNVIIAAPFYFFTLP